MLTRDGFGLNKVTKVKISSHEKSVYYYVDNVAKLQLLKTWILNYLNILIDIIMNWYGCEIRQNTYISK